MVCRQIVCSVLTETPILLIFCLDYIQAIANDKNVARIIPLLVAEMAKPIGISTDAPCELSRELRALLVRAWMGPPGAEVVGLTTQIKKKNILWTDHDVCGMFRVVLKGVQACVVHPATSSLTPVAQMFRGCSVIKWVAFIRPWSFKRPFCPKWSFFGRFSV